MEKHFNELIETVLQTSSFSESTKAQTEWVISDTIIAILFGVKTEKEISRYLDSLKTEKSYDSSFPILGTNLMANKKNNLIIHGTAVVSNELDEGNTFAKGHPSAHIVPSLFIAAYENDSTIEQVIEIFIKAYEISSRLSYATNMNDSLHPHGTWGNVGGAVARALIEGKTVDEVKKIVLLGLSLPLATSWLAAEKGQKVRNLYTGLGSVVAYESVDLSGYGFSSSYEVVENLWGELLSSGINPIKLTDSLTNPFMIDQNYMKIFPFCRFTHSAIDATQSIMTRVNLDINKIGKINIDTYDLAARCNIKVPNNNLQSKFSIPYAVACTLLNIDMFNDYHINKHKVDNLSKKILVYNNQRLTSLLPNKRGANVEIVMVNGDTYSDVIYNAKGEYNDKYSKKEMWNKYNNMLSKYYSKDHLKLLEDNLLHMRKFNKFKDWLFYNKIIQEET